MGNRLRPAAYLGGVAVFGVVAALLFASLRMGLFGAGPVSSPTPPVPTRAGTAPSPRPAPSPRLLTLPPAPPTPEPSVVPVPEPTPWPAWLVIPEDTWGDPDDSDGDGLTDAREGRFGTDRYAWDTDYGGERDGSEVAAGRDPLDDEDDVPAKSACIPEDAERFDVPSDSDPPPAPELEALMPEEIGGVDVHSTSMRGLPRVYGFFNFFWDAVLACAGGQPEDMSHALGVRGTLPEFAIMAIHVDGADAKKLGRDLMSDLGAQGNGRRAAVSVDLDGRKVTFLLDADVDGISFAAYATDEVLFLMTGMGFTDAGFWPGGVLDPEHVREAVAEFPPA